MKVTNEEYDKMTKKASSNSPILKNIFFAFVSGGTISFIGQLLFNLYSYQGLDEKNSRALVSITLIFVGIILTAFNLFDKIAKYSGAGTLVPITGFANSVVAPAIEFKREGQILGLGAKMFTIAGPVIVFGTISSVLYGIIACILHLY